jgi:hypothetical protein
MLERIRVAMSDEAIIARGKQISRSGLNLGVGLMYVGVWPALAAVLLSPSALPLAFLIVTIELIVIVFGSAPLLRLFQTDDVHKEVERARRKEIAFGSTLMYLGTIIATLIVAVATPDWWIRLALVGAITAVFGGLLASSKSLYKAYRDVTSNELIGLEPAPAQSELTTASLDTEAVELRIPQGNARMHADPLEPHSVIEETTRLLEISAPQSGE